MFRWSNNDYQIRSDCGSLRRYCRMKEAFSGLKDTWMKTVENLSFSELYVTLILWFSDSSGQDISEAETRKQTRVWKLQRDAFTCSPVPPHWDRMNSLHWHVDHMTNVLEKLPQNCNQRILEVQGNLSILHILYHSSWCSSLLEFRNVPELVAACTYIY